MRFLFIALVSTLIISACTENKVEDYNKAFSSYSEEFVDELWKMYPGWASSVGFHDYDSVLVIPSDETRAKELTFLDEQLKTLQDFPVDELSAGNQTDYYLIENQLKSAKWGLQTFKSYQWDPSSYNVCGSFAELLNSSHAPLEKRLRSIAYKLKHVPAFYAAAKKAIKRPTKEHVELAISQNQGGSSVFTLDLVVSVNKSKLEQSEKDAILLDAKKATAAILDYVTFLQKIDLSKARSFRLGEKLYAEKFAFDIQAAYTPKEIYARAIAHKRDLHTKMIKLSHELWSKHMGNKPKPANDLDLVRQLIDQLSLVHVSADSFQTAIDKQIPTLVEFVNKKKLLYLDPKKPLVVRKEPDYMAGVAGASISAPGPYDKMANTYYNVGSLSGWSPEEAESYLREYNAYILQILNIHEAIPGHYTQLVYSNLSPSLIKSILGNGTMVEGWAVYTERMMLENGYGNNEPELWLMYYKWNLRTTCNTILDYGIHNLNWSKERVLNLLTKEAFQQQAEAEGKWRRATLTQVQLCSYFTGYSEIMDFRDAQQSKLGDKFDLRKFHETFLGYGSAPVKYIRQLMEKEQ